MADSVDINVPFTVSVVPAAPRTEKPTKTIKPNSSISSGFVEDNVLLAVPEHAYSVQIEDGSAQLRFSLLTDANLAPGAKLTLTLYPGVSDYVYCEHCVVPYECSLDATTQQCAFVLQPCLYDGQNHDNSLLVVSATGITQVLLYTVNYESVASTPEPLKSGVSLDRKSVV